MCAGARAPQNDEKFRRKYTPRRWKLLGKHISDRAKLHRNPPIFLVRDKRMCRVAHSRANCYPSGRQTVHSCAQPDRLLLMEPCVPRIADYGYWLQNRDRFADTGYRIARSVNGRPAGENDGLSLIACPRLHNAVTAPANTFTFYRSIAWIWIVAGSMESVRLPHVTREIDLSTPLAVLIFRELVNRDEATRAQIYRSKSWWINVFFLIYLLWLCSQVNYKNWKN